MLRVLYTTSSTSVALRKIVRSVSIGAPAMLSAVRYGCRRSSGFAVSDMTTPVVRVMYRCGRDITLEGRAQCVLCTRCDSGISAVSASLFRGRVTRASDGRLRLKCFRGVCAVPSTAVLSLTGGSGGSTASGGGVLRCCGTGETTLGLYFG